MLDCHYKFVACIFREQQTLNLSAHNERKHSDSFSLPPAATTAAAATAAALSGNHSNHESLKIRKDEERENAAIEYIARHQSSEPIAVTSHPNPNRLHLTSKRI